MSKPAREYLASLVAGDHLKEALGILLDQQLEIPDAIRRQAFILSGRYNQMQEEVLKKNRDSRELDIEKNQIRDGLLSLAANLPETLEITPKHEKEIKQQKIKLRISVVAYALIAGFVWWASVSDKRNIQVQLDLQLSRLAFEPERMVSLFEGEKVESLNLQNFHQCTFYADSLAIDADYDGVNERSIMPNERVVLHPLEGLSSVSVRLSQLNIEELDVLKDALVTITHVEDDPQRFRMQVQQSDTIRGRLNYSHQLELSGTYLEVVRGLEDIEFWEEPVQLTAYGLSESAKEVDFSGYPEDFILELDLKDSCVQNDIMVQKLSFLKPDQQQIRSSILGGRLLIKELDKSPMNIIPINESERLDIILNDKLNIQRLSLRPDGIFIRAIGRVEYAYTFVSGERKTHNPSRIEWFWHNHPWEVSIIGVLLLGFLILFPGPIGNRLLEWFRLVRG